MRNPATVPPVARSSAYMPRRAVIALLAVVLAAVAAGPAEARKRPKPVQAVASTLQRDGQPFRVYGFNYEFDGVHPNVDYLAAPTAAGRARIWADLAEAAELGANTVRLFVPLGAVMASERQVRPEALEALRRTLAAAEAAGLLVDLTGNVVWDPGPDTAWYDALPEGRRWRVQERFWRAVAGVGARSRAILAYELTSEPAIGDAPGWYAGELGGSFFIQYVVRRLRGRDPAALAREWTIRMRDAVRSADPRHLVTIGLLPDPYGPFRPGNVADLLDLVTVHEYAAAGKPERSVELIRQFAAHGRPVLLGECFGLHRATHEAFLLGARPWLDGTMSFYDGRAPEDVVPATIVDALYQQNLITYLGLQRALRRA